MPPLRTAIDVAALRKALVDGVIDAVATDHAPHADHEKDVPFEQAANAMDRKNVQRIIDLEALLDYLNHQVADTARGNADNQRTDRADESGCRRNRRETRDRTRNETDKARFAVLFPFDRHPGQRSSGR